MAFTPKVSGQYTSFDTELSSAMVNGTTNAELTIVLRLMLSKLDARQTGGAVSDGTRTHAVQNWTETEWRTYRHNLLENCAAAWNGRFWLVPPADYAGLDWPARPAAPTHRPNVWCKLKIEPVDNIGRAHRKIVCIRTPAGGFRSFTGTGGSGLAGTGEPVTTFDYFDLRPEHYHFAGPETGTGGTQLRYRTTFRAAIHEFGHILGLDHPDKHVHISGGHHDEYGMSRASREDVMGYGCKMDASSAVPWLKRIAAHTGIPAGRWTVKLGPDSAALRPKRLGG